MAKKNAKQDPDQPVESDIPFEEALLELQQVVAELEDGAIGLEESMQRFERGTALLRCCYQTLEKAERRIEILTGLDADGNPTTAPFDASATADSSAPSAGRRKRKDTPPPSAGPDSLFD